jgi:hypothetical protein
MQRINFSRVEFMYKAAKNVYFGDISQKNLEVYQLS